MSIPHVRRGPDEPEVKKVVADLKGIPTQEKLIEILQTGVLIVTFNKLDGDERVMTCTKNNENIPEDMRPKTDNTVDIYGQIEIEHTEREMNIERER